MIRERCAGCPEGDIRFLNQPHATGSYFFARMGAARFLMQIVRWDDESRKHELAWKVHESSQYELLLRVARIPVVRAIWFHFSATHRVGLVAKKVGEGELLSAVLARETLSPQRLVALATGMLALADELHEKGFTLHQFTPSNMLVALDDMSLQIVDVQRLTKASLPIIHVLNLLSSCEPRGNRHERANYAVLMPVYLARYAQDAGLDGVDDTFDVRHWQTLYASLYMVGEHIEVDDPEFV